MQKVPTTDLDLLVFEKMNKGAVILKSEKVKGQEHPLFRIIYVNASYFEIYRLKQDELPTGKLPLLNYLNTEQQKRFLQLKQPGDSTRFEYFHPLLQSWQKLSIYCPQPTYFAILIEDITQKKSLEQELIESEETLRLTLETAGEGLWQWHYSDDLIYHNRRWAQTMGLPEDSTFHDLDFFLNHVHPDDVERVTAALDIAVKNEKIYFSEHRMVLDDGSIIWIQDRGLPVKDENGIFYRMVGSMVDITKYKKAQLDLFLEKEIIRSAILSVGDGIITTDRDGIIQIFNPAAENMTGWKSEQAIGMQVKDIFKLFNADMRSRNPLEKTSDSEVEDYKFSKARRGKLKIRWGGMLEIYYSVAPINLPEGQTCGHIIVFTDISELVEKQKQIEYLSFHDDLTGLYNRHYLKDALKRLDTDRLLPFTILVLDINNLKKINDDFGHSEGDNLIKLAADFLRSNFRQEDIIARIGGDEFCVLLPNTSAAVAASIKQRLLNNAGRRKTDKCTLSLSIGYAVKQDPAESIDLTLIKADNAMYKHKEKQKAEAQNLS